MYRFIIISLLVLAVSGCSRPDQEPQFLRVDNIGVDKISGTEAILTGQAIFHNPNDVKMKLRKVAINVELEGKRIGTINQELTTKIPALSDFSVPLKASFDLTEIGLLNGILSILGGKKVEVQYKGFIKVSVHGYPVTVPIDYTEEFRM
ncbi:MAG: LEA type 2 family protein [Cyclobacteriaceae bacterium]